MALLYLNISIHYCTKLIYRTYVTEAFPRSLTKLLVTNGANLSITINSVSGGEDHPHTLMEFAIDKDDIDMVKFLLENGDDVNR